MSKLADTPSWIQFWLDAKCGASPSSTIRWSNLLKSVAEFKGPILEAVLESCHNPEMFDHFRLLLLREKKPREALETFIDYVQESEESMESWLESLHVLSLHTAETITRPILSGASGFVHCASFTVSPNEKYETLPDATRTMLSIYGYEGRVEKEVSEEDSVR